MTKEEYNEAAALVVRLCKELEHTNQHVVAHIDALTKSNAQCGEYLRHNEMLRAELDRISAERDTMQTKLHSELVNVRAALAATTEQRDSLKRTLQEWEEAETKPHVRVEPVSMTHGPAGSPVFIHEDSIADHVVPPVLPMCMTCHHCGNALDASIFGPYNVCTTIGCPRTVTNNDDGEDKSPYNGPCTSSHPVRHE